MKDPEDLSVNENEGRADEDPALSRARSRMVRDQIAARGVKDDRLLEAMRSVPRDRFVAREAVEFAYEDTALPIDEGQTISQPYIVAVMAEALEIGPRDRVLDVGTGSGYAAAVLAELAAEVITVERHPSLARSAERRFERLGIDNVTVRVHDGTLGWEPDAPYDAINVAAGGPSVPQELLDQLAPGGRLVIPVGSSEAGAQQLLRVRRTPDGFERTDLGAVRFVPLVGERGWKEREGGGKEREGTGSSADLPARIADAAEPFGAIGDADLDGLLDRIGGARVVLLGEATHGTSEFYRMRARITRELVERRGFDLVAVEADWPDAARVDRWVRHEGGAPPEDPPFARFPKWMWVNEEVRDFTEWLREHNASRPEDDRVSFHGLDLYSLHGSADAVLDYLDDVDPDAADVARERYGCLTPWQRDPATYGRAVLSRGYESCEDDVVDMLRHLLEKRMEYQRESGRRRYLDAATNARVVANAEQYYRIMYYGGRKSWNLRDRHMFDTLADLLDFRGPDSKAVVWEHNSHVGDASATDMGRRGEHNVGQLARERFGRGAYLVGFGTDRGTVAAAHDWGDPVEIMEVRPSREDSYEHLCHRTGVERFLLPLRAKGGGATGAADASLLRELRNERLERAIGVIYRPQTERRSHYFHASLPDQFDEYVWFDESEAVTPIGEPAGGEGELEQVPDTFPFAV